MKTATLTLDAPLTIDGREVTEITLREPRASDLRGVMLANLLQGSAEAYVKLLPRISTPPLTAAQVEAMPLGQLVSVMQAMTDFFTDGRPTPDV